MTLPYSPSSSFARTLLASEPGTKTVLQAAVGPLAVNGVAGAAYKTVGVSPGVPQLQYVNGAADGSVVYGNMRYLVPMQPRADSYVLVNQAQQVVPQVMPQVVQQVMPQVVSPMYLQRVSMSSGDESELFHHVETLNGKSASVFSQTPSPTKSPEPVHQEVEEDRRVLEEVVRKVEMKTILSEPEPVAKLDTRYFGELLAEVYRKNVDIHSYVSKHVEKIGRKNFLDPTISKVELEEVEALIPKGLSELTKQQIRYLLQSRLTSDKTMSLLLSTFGSLKESLVHMEKDLRMLETEKDDLERTVAFKSDQLQQYDQIIESLRRDKQRLQTQLTDSSNSQRSLEKQIFNSRNTDTDRTFRIKEMEGRNRALEQENEMLRQKAGQVSVSTMQMKSDELSRQYNDMLKSLREEKDREVQNLRTQLIKIQTERTTTVQSSDRSLQLRISELLSTLEQREILIKRQEEELRRLQERNDSSKNVTKTIITKRYRNQYPILGLLSDDYLATSPVKEAKTIVIEKTGEMIKQEIIVTP
ncbi:protein POF1B isoform X2 [Denticeps clupeoides]|uniref:protein POF1B isoform X2 n=1 Tax=Denticeps clupeoides TaxID=299321 RepID=UPI0010A4830C|nr:protein POF1B isoform X2 [Denticeps clupeoides]